VRTIRIPIEPQRDRRTRAGDECVGHAVQMVHSGSSYASQSELVLTFGLGGDTQVSRIDVEWPSGRKQTFADLASRQVSPSTSARAR